MADEYEAPDWYGIAQAAAEAAREIAAESVGARIEAIRLRALNRGKDIQIEIQGETIGRYQSLRNEIKPVLDIIEMFQESFEKVGMGPSETIRDYLGDSVMNAILNIDVPALRKECGCGELDPG